MKLDKNSPPANWLRAQPVGSEVWWPAEKQASLTLLPCSHTHTHTHTHTTAATQAHTPCWLHAAASASLACSEKCWLLEQLGSRPYVSPLANFLQVLVPFCRTRRAHCAILSFTANACLTQRLLPITFTLKENKKNKSKICQCTASSQPGCTDCCKLKVTPALLSFSQWQQRFMQSHPSLMTEQTGALFPSW